VLNGTRPIDRRNVDNPRVSTRKGGLTRTVAARLPQLVLERLPVLDGVRLERTSSVQHLVSTIAGRLAPGRDAFDFLAATFPGGSITGAPKIRAMELIEALEPVRRGPYCGAALWVDAAGAMGSSILIRAFVADGLRLTFHVGGGITWRSDAAAEWEETRTKARGPLRAIGGRVVGEEQP
jgi:para-aminobenzoate synthetase component 1